MTKKSIKSGVHDGHLKRKPGTKSTSDTGSRTKITIKASQRDPVTVRLQFTVTTTYGEPDISHNPIF
jgi:hypothetical protein